MKKLVFLLGLIMAMMVSVSASAQVMYKMDNGTLYMYKDSYKQNAVTNYRILDYAYYSSNYVIVIDKNYSAVVYHATGGVKSKIASGRSYQKVQVQNGVIYLTPKGGGTAVMYTLSNGVPKKKY